jgi:hypothetical protein
MNLAGNTCKDDHDDDAITQGWTDVGTCHPAAARPCNCPRKVSFNCCVQISIVLLFNFALADGPHAGEAAQGAA